MIAVNELAEHLEGTCKTFSQGCEDLGLKEDELKPDFLSNFSEYIFCCEICGWWCEVGEMDENGDCKDCSDHNDKYY